MSTQPAAPSTSSASTSGALSVLRYTGIPPSWFSKRPKLPSRNWLIFWSITSSLAGYYIYDRRECKKIRQRYIDMVQDLAEERPSDHFELPRKVTVYGCKWPGDEDYDQAAKYFRKFIKPIFVAAAIDYEIVIGKKHGDLANRIAEEVRTRRRLDAGLDYYPSREHFPPNYPYKSLQEVRQRELEGGIVVVGRPAWKEFLYGLKQGWTQPLDTVDHDEVLARELEEDAVFDEVFEGDEAPASPKPIQTSPLYAALQQQRQQPKPPASSNIPPHLNEPPPTIPPLPPLLLVSFSDLIGFKLIPVMIWEWFNQREKVEAGGQAAYRLIRNQTRSIDHSSPTVISESKEEVDATVTPTQGGDLDFDLHAEKYFHPVRISDIEKARKEYYAKLPEHLKIARELARGEREPTKHERDYPPKTEVELRSERMNKEKKWRGQLAGWDIIKPGQGVEWDERFDHLRVFSDPN